MKEYRDHANITGNEQASSSSSQPSNPRPEKWQTLDQQYGLDDMYELETEEDTQTLEQEYQSYATGILAKHGIDIVKYWDVRLLIFVLPWFH
jgi:hypothetical protein